MQETPHITSILEKYPFMSYGVHGETHYIGIIQNSGPDIVSMYDFASIPTVEMRVEFLRLGEKWWYESNRQTPIHIFYRDNQFKVFRPYLRHFVKEFELISGHTVSLNKSIEKRVRRRSTTILRKMD